MPTAAEQLRGFDAFHRLVTQRGSGADYARRIEATLAPFLADPVAYRDIAHEVLELHTALWACARVPLARSALQGTIERLAQRIRSLALGARAERPALAQVAALVRDPATLTERPRAARQALDALLDQPSEYGAHVDLIADAYAAASVASRFPLAEPILRVAMQRESRRWSTEVDALLTELKQRDAMDRNDVPIVLDAGFLPVASLPVPREYAGYSASRRLGVAARMRVTPREGFRLREVKLDVALQESASVLSAGGEAASDGSEADLTIATSTEHVTSRELAWKAGLSVAAPFVPAKAGVEATAKQAWTQRRETSSKEVIKGGMRLQATAMDHMARLLLKIEDGLPTAGDGGFPLAASLSLNVWVSTDQPALDASLSFEISAGWYEGKARHEQRLEIPPLAAARA